MAKVILICGKICSGKSWYAERLREKEKAVVLSHDELMLSLFDPLLGDKHDEIAAKASAYLYGLAAKLLDAQVSVILDWGFWTRDGRKAARAYFEERGAQSELHYVSVTDEVWRGNIERRNELVLRGKTGAYFVDEGLLKKLESRFEEPVSGEAEIVFENIPDEKYS